MLPGFYKKLIAIVLVVAPIYWLMFTNDGMSRIDSVMLQLSGDEPVEVNIKALNGGYTEAELKKVYSDLPWQCVDQVSAYGQRFCHARIASLNGIPAHYLTAFFKEGVLKAMKMVYRPRYHEDMALQLRDQLGKPSNLGADEPVGAPLPHAVFQWQLDGSAVVIKQALLEGDEAAVMWLNTARVMKQSQ